MPRDHFHPDCNSLAARPSLVARLYATGAVRASRGLALGLACGLIAWLLSQTEAMGGLEDLMLDESFAYRGNRASKARIVLIGLDELSLDRMHKPAVFISPELAEVVQHANSQGAKAIGFDIFIPDALSSLPDIAKPGSPGDALLLGKEYIRAGNVVLPEWQVGDGWRRPLAQWRLTKATEPVDIAFLNLTDDVDQTVRRQQLIITDQARQDVPALGLALYAKAHHATFEWDERRQRLKVGEVAVPLDAEQKMRINFVGPPGTFPTLPFMEVLGDARAGRPTPALSGAVVLIGQTSHTDQDYYSTPYANNFLRYFDRSSYLMSATELHANIVATLEDRAFITTPWWLNPLPLLLLVGGVLGWLLARLRLLAGFALTVAHHLGWKFGVATLALSWFDWHIEVMGMLLTGFLCYATTFAFRWQRLRKMFGVVKSRELVAALEADSRRLNPGGKELEVTVLFADVRDFTTYSEKHDARQVVALLNDYYSAIVPLIQKEGGTIMTYMGDGIMVLFNALTPRPNHALNGTQAALAIVQRVHELKELWAVRDCHGVWAEHGGMRIGVGVHTGRVVVGAIGSPGQLDYTAIGDTVNAAARIESENKSLHSEVLISEATRAQLQAIIQAAPPAQAQSAAQTLFRRLGDPQRVHVKGRAEELTIYALKVP